MDVMANNLLDTQIKKIVIYFQDGRNMTVSTGNNNYSQMGIALEIPENRINIACDVSELLEQYLDLFKRPNVSPGYMVSLNCWNRKYITPSIGSMTVNEVTTTILQELLISIPVNNTRKKIKTYLKGFFNWLVNEGAIARNPIFSVKLRNYRAIKRRAFEFEEQNQMLEILPQKYRGVFFFLCCTSMRLGEFCAFTKEKAYDQKLHVFEALNIKTGKIGCCKTNSSKREVPYIDELFTTATALSGGVDIFGTEINYYGIKQAFKKAINRLKNNKSSANGKLSTHSTRHTFSSVCYYLGMRDKQIQEWMGHATVAMTIDTYTHMVHVGSSPILEYLIKLIDNSINFA